MRKGKGILVIVSLFLMFSGCAKNGSLVVLHTNDHHGHPMAFYDYPCGDQGGLPARATFVESVRAENENVLVLDAGDLNTGRPESNFFKAEPDILAYNHIGYDALALGNHEFDVDEAGMQKQIAQADFPWLCANVKKEGQYIENVKPYIIKNYKGIKVAIFGLISSNTSKTGNPENIKGLVFENEIEVAKKLVPELREKADVVIALVHMGIYKLGAFKGKVRGSVALAEQVPGIDLVVDGHTHTKLSEPVMVLNIASGKKVPVVQAHHWGLHVGKGVFQITDGQVSDFKWNLEPINVQYRKKDKDGKKTYHYVGEKIEKDAELLAKLTVYKDKVDKVLDQVIGDATEVFSNKQTREKETALGDLVSDSQLWYMKKMGFSDVAFAFQNGGGIRATLGSGEIKKSTVYEVLPFDNSIVVVTLKGSDVLALFAQASGNIGHGSMPQVSQGVKFSIDKNAKKLIDLSINGKKVDPNKEYKVVTNSYLASGGDGYKVFKEKRLDFYDSSNMQRDAFIDYVIAKKGVVTPKTYNRIEIK